MAASPTTYTATFSSNGGSSVSAASFIAGASISEPTVPTRSGYTFNGWSTTLNDVATKVSFPYSPGVSANITVYALWTQNPAPSNSGGSSPVLNPVLTPKPPATPVTKPIGEVEGSTDKISIVADAPKDKLIASGGGWQLEVSAKAVDGQITKVQQDLTLNFQIASKAELTGSGLRPLTKVSVWVFSDPTYVGEVQTDGVGNFASSLTLPATILPGQHTLQILSTDTFGRTVTLNLPITVVGKVTVGTSKGYLALYTKDLMGQELSAKVAGKWLVQDPIANYKSYGYSRLTRKTGAGYRIYVHLYLNGSFLRTDVITTR
ncbi:MAG: InlB B-repeat-containing protein [Aquiluna sp.]|nr:InlB B-repeat-containing protein [Aquiluna sp.]